jgi:hypothetical protein
MVGDVSANNPVDYFEQQKVPYFGYAFDFTYCSNEPNPDIWGFGYNGCLVPDDPQEMPDSYRHIYTYAKEKTGKEHPTVAMFSNDTTVRQEQRQVQASSASVPEFDVVYRKACCRRRRSPTTRRTCRSCSPAPGVAAGCDRLSAGGGLHPDVHRHWRPQGSKASSPHALLRPARRAHEGLGVGTFYVPSTPRVCRRSTRSRPTSQR